MSDLVQATNIKTWFAVRKGIFRSGVVRAVDGVSLSIRRGETLAVVGESGSGKTTLGRTLLRLVDVHSGQLLFDGQDITALDRRNIKRFRRRAQAIFQDPYASISPYMNVLQIVEEPLVVHGVNNKAVRLEKVLAALEQVNMSPAEEILNKFPHNLSGGQRQRVSIARAIILEPAFIVADEPVSMVDASNRSEILYLLRDLQRRLSIAFLYITHDIASARFFSDRTAVMYLGTIVEQGFSKQVIGDPKHPYTQGLLAAVPDPDPENRNRLRQVIDGEPPNAGNAPTGCPFHPRCPKKIGGICETTRPTLATVDSHREVACHLYSERKSIQ